MTNRLKSIAIRDKISQADHEGMLEGFDVEDVDADILKKEGLKDITEERKKSVQENLPELEKAAAKQATSGMAYSGPAGQVLTEAQEGNVMDLLEIKKKEQGVVKDYKDEIDRIEENRQAAIAARAVEKSGTIEEIGGEFGELAERAQEVGNLGYDILQGHQTYGQTLQGSGMGAYVGQNRYGGGAFGTGNTWGEADTPEAGRLYQMGEEAATFAEDVQSAAMNEAMSLIEGLTDLT